MLETMMVGMIEPGPEGMRESPSPSWGRFIMDTRTCLLESSRSDMSSWASKALAEGARCEFQSK